MSKPIEITFNKENHPTGAFIIYTVSPDGQSYSENATVYITERVLENIDMKLPDNTKVLTIFHKNDPKTLIDALKDNDPAMTAVVIVDERNGKDNPALRLAYGEQDLADFIATIMAGSERDPKATTYEILLNNGK